MTRSLGIILKRSSPEKQMYSILDAKEGVLFCYISREDICTGAYIEYSITKNRTKMIAQDVELIEVPCVSNVADLLLLHKALELCSQCMPTGSSSPGTFELMRSFYNKIKVIQLRTSKIKKIFLCKLLIILGFYPQGKKFQNPFFYKLATESLDNLWTLPLSMIQESDIEQWLQVCMATHVQEQKFKTGSIDKWVEIL